MEGTNQSESPFRDYSIRSWMGPLMSGSYKAPKELENQDTHQTQQAEETDNGYKYLSPEDYYKTIMMVSIAKCIVKII